MQGDFPSVIQTQLQQHHLKQSACVVHAYASHCREMHTQLIDHELEIIADREKEAAVYDRQHGQSNSIIPVATKFFDGEAV